MSKDPRKEALKKAWREQEEKKLADSIPMPVAELKELFDFLDRPGAPVCDHSMRQTLEFLAKKKLSAELVVPWLREHGGYCDCEVLANVEDKVERIIGR